MTKDQGGAQEQALWAVSDTYDQQLVQVMGSVLSADGCAIDIGAHWGKIVKHIVRIAPRGTHWAFEPLPHLAEYLRKKYPSVRVVQAAVSDTAGTSSFVHVKNDEPYSGLKRRIYDRPDVVLQSITVDLVRLDDVVPNDQRISFIKIDIEGGEFHALRGAQATILRERPIVVFEASEKSTGQYGVKPEDFYELITDQISYYVSTMRRWLDRQPPFTREKFCDNWHKEDGDFFFIAFPVAASALGAR